jgi:hypothetical protein
MARSIETVRQSIITNALTKPALNGLNFATPSAASEFMSHIDITAHAIHETEVIQDTKIADLSVRIAAQEPGTLQWYQLRCLEFQLGDALVDTNYAIIDPVKQIITRASVLQEDNGTLTVKLAKGAVGEEVALSSTELQQFTNYFEKIKYAGTIASIISLNADELKLTGEIWYDGLLNVADVQAGVQAALEEFLATGIGFSGDLYVNKIIDVLQNVTGVIDPKLTEVKVIVGLFETVVDQIYRSSAGYLKESPDFAFLDTLTFVPK